MKLTHILETSLYARDLAAAERFYTEVLGFELYSRQEGRHLFFRCENGMLLIFNPETTRKEGAEVPPHGAEGAGHVAFAVPPETLPRWREHLNRKGVAIEAEVRWPGGGESLYFRDPAGNSLEITSPGIWRFPEGFLPDS